MTFLLLLLGAWFTALVFTGFGFWLHAWLNRPDDTEAADAAWWAMYGPGNPREMETRRQLIEAGFASEVAAFDRASAERFDR